MTHTSLQWVGLFAIQHPSLKNHIAKTWYHYIAQGFRFQSADEYKEWPNHVQKRTLKTSWSTSSRVGLLHIKQQFSFTYFFHFNYISVLIWTKANWAISYASVDMMICCTCLITVIFGIITSMLCTSKPKECLISWLSCSCESYPIISNPIWPTGKRKFASESKAIADTWAIHSFKSVQNKPGIIQV